MQIDSIVVVLSSRRVRSAVKQLIDPRTQKKIQVFSGGKKQLEVRPVCVLSMWCVWLWPSPSRVRPSAHLDAALTHAGACVCAGTAEGVGH